MHNQQKKSLRYLSSVKGLRSTYYQHQPQTHNNHQVNHPWQKVAGVGIRVYNEGMVVVDEMKSTVQNHIKAYSHAHATLSRMPITTPEKKPYLFNTFNFQNITSNSRTFIN